MSETELCDALGIASNTAARWRRTGQGPRFIRLGPRRIAYSVTEVENWAATRTYQSNAAELAGTPK